MHIKSGIPPNQAVEINIDSYDLSQLETCILTQPVPPGCQVDHMLAW